VHVLVHGGAGGVPDDPAPRQSVLDAAARAGAAAATPLDAVQTALEPLEADPRFNAGVGGAVQSDGVPRTDAGIMTSDRRVGAVAGLTGVRDATAVARAVLTETPHILLAGERAVRFADAVGVETGLDTWSEDTRGRWAEADAPASADVEGQLAWVRDRFGGTTADPSSTARPKDRADESSRPASGAGEGAPDGRDHDTVGAVARDGERFAAATSTGGRWAALAGRVGDVPQVGAGFYCSPAGAASVTGAGEDIARVTLARRAVRGLETGLAADRAAARAIAEFADLTGSDAGVIVAGPAGVGSAVDAAGMQTSAARE
jgi:beta-aspartyl-peptidase (threonine type)